MANSNNSTDPVYSYIKAIVLLIVYLASMYEAKAQVHLVKDLNTEPQSSYWGAAKQMGSAYYFGTYTNQYGAELWKTDGTPGGTVLIKDIYPGPMDSNPRQFIVVNDILYFIANDGKHGDELWRSDGTSEGTILFKDLEEGEASSFVQEMAVADGRLFVNVKQNNRCFLKAITYSEMISVIDMGNIRYLTSAGNAIYFSGDGSSDTELWRSEGTEETTGVVKDITGDNISTTPTNLTYLNGTLYFSAYTTAFGIELWKTDGTADGTSMISNIAPGNANSWPTKLTISGNKIYFIAYTTSLGNELWVTDGTSTALVKDISSGTSTEFGELFGVNGSLFFTAATSVGMELWKTDGTTTSMVKDIASGPTGSNPSNYTLANGTLFFSAYDERYGVELWKTDGTTNGTVLVKEIAEDMNNSNPISLFELNNNLYFWADDLSHGWELWTSTQSGETKLFKDLAVGTVFADISGLVADENAAWFADYATGVWRTDGSEAGTKNIRQRFENESNKRFLKTSDALYFVAHVADLNRDILMMSDGINEAGPLQTNGFKSISWLKEIDGVLYLGADQDGTGMELWKWNGNYDDFTLVLDINNGPEGSNPSKPFVYNGAMYFHANDGAHGYELWKCEGGTALGTKMIKDIYEGTAHGNPQEFVVSNGKIFFNATTAEYGQEVWVSDGTDAGTHMVADIFPGPLFGNPLSFVTLNDVVYFFAQDGQHGFELWRTDGTEEGTRMVKDIYPSSETYFENPDWLTVVNGQLYFSASDGEHGIELWASDGTEAGTHMVKDVTPGPQGSLLYWFSEVNGHLFFVENGKLWRSNGTECSTLPVLDNTEVSFYESFQPVVSGDKLFFVGISDEAGAELFYYDFSTVNDPGCTQTIALEEIDPKTIGDADFELHATSSAGLPVTFSVADNSVIGIDGNRVTIKAAGEVVITATQAGDINYARVYATQGFVINKKQQVITFDELEEKIAGQSPFSVTATSSSGLPVVFESGDDNIVKINGSTVTIIGPGEVSVTAKQNGNAEYSAATPVTQALIVKVITALEEDADKLISVYPNPATDFVIIGGSATRDGSRVNLMNIDGRVLNSVENETTLDVRSLPVGLYLVRVTTKDFVVTKRIVKK